MFIVSSQFVELKSYIILDYDFYSGNSYMKKMHYFGSLEFIYIVMSI